MKKINNIFWIILSVLFLLQFCKCRTKNNVIKVGYIPIAECLPLYVAKEKGYFEKYGLEVELISESGGPRIFTELNSELIDIGFSNVVTLIKQKNIGYGCRSIFGATYETDVNCNHAIFGKGGTGSIINGASRFGINARNNIEELMLLNYLLELKIPITNDLLTHFIETPFPQMLPGLRDGNIDFACIVEPSITAAKNDTVSFKYIGNHYSADDSNKVLVATYVSKDTVIQKKRKEIESFIKAMTEATDYINRNPVDARGYVKKYSKIPEALLPKISLPEFDVKIDEGELREIIDLMYNPKLNFNHSFITKPENRVLPNELIYQ